jgi:hypothetical protein
MRFEWSEKRKEREEREAGREESRPEEAGDF